MLLEDKVVFITGASSGMGKACAMYFAREGARLILTGRRYERLKELTHSLEKEYGRSHLPLILDVQSKDSVRKTFASMPKDFSSIDILINCAGVALTSDKIQEGDPDKWDQMINTNFRGFLYVLHEILPGMITNEKGHILHIGSSGGLAHYPGGNVYK